VFLSCAKIIETVTVAVRKLIVAKSFGGQVYKYLKLFAQTLSWRRGCSRRVMEYTCTGR